MEQQINIRDMRHKEKFQIDDLYLNGYAKKCGIYATGVYVSLCRHANKLQKSYPSLKRIAEELNISRSQVIRAIKALKKYNIIFVSRAGKKLNNRYFLIDKTKWVGYQSEVSSRNFTGSQQELHLVSDRNFHSKDTQYKDTHIKEDNFNYPYKTAKEIIKEKMSFK
jgi:biotin operon repressor